MVTSASDFLNNDATLKLRQKIEAYILRCGVTSNPTIIQYDGPIPDDILNEYREKGWTITCDDFVCNPRTWIYHFSPVK